MKFYSIILISFLFASFKASAQNDSLKIDSLKKVLMTEIEDTNKVNTLNELSWAYYQSNDNESVLRNAKYTLALAEKLKFKSGQADAFFVIAISYKNQPEAFQYYTQALNLYKEISNKQAVIMCYDNIANTYMQQENYGEALKNAFAGMKAREETADKNLIAEGFFTIASIYWNLNDDSEVLKNTLSSLKIYKQLNDTPAIGRCNLLIAGISVNSGNFSDALKKYYEVLQFLKDGSSPYDIAFAYGRIASIYEKQGELEFTNGNKLNAINKYHEAKKSQLISLRIYQSLSSQGSIAACFLDLGIIEIKLNNLNTARKYIDSAFFINTSIASKSGLMNDYSGFSTLDSMQGNYKEAYKNYKLAALYRDSISLEENTKKSVQIQMQYEFDKKEALAKADQDKKDADAKRVKSQQYFIITALAIIVLAVIILASIQYRNNRQKQKANKVLETTLTNLKSTQSQLIQSEKMASLGELTAGIAHEIQNPLNFVNNFSEVNTELIDELQQEVDKGNLQEIKMLANDIKENEEKINHHGKRAGDIVKGMLQHSRTSTGKKEPTDINALCDEYLRLSYNGLRAKDKDFNATMQTNFDESIGKINIVPQDIGRVILNLINNAFYAVNEKKKTANENYEPNVFVSTKKVTDKVLISVKDNGNGIPKKIVDKIFQPFFTTKPTGSGTGLGLSLSYDIIKAHGGEIKVESKEGEGSEFIVQLPITA